MATHIYSDFLKSEKVYNHCKSLWAALVDERIGEASQEGEWSSWWPKTYGDGSTPLAAEDRPIFDAMSSVQKKAFSISQIEPTSEESEIEVWLRELSYRGTGKYAGYTELVVQLQLSDETMGLARGILSDWMETDIGPDLMTKKVDKFKETGSW